MFKLSLILVILIAVKFELNESKKKSCTVKVVDSLRNGKRHSDTNVTV